MDAQVTFDRLFPPVVKAASETTVTAEGKFPNWPPKVVVDHPGVSVEPQKESGKLSVSVLPNTASGTAWVRLHDDKSASALVPIVVTNLDVQQESEPNNKIDDANLVEMPSVICGKLHRSGEVDSFRVHIEAGKSLVATVTANRVFKSPMDTVMQVCDLRGNVLTQSDDEIGLDPQIVYRSETDTDVIVRLFAFPETPNSTIGFSGSASYLYSLQLTTDALLDHALPLIVASQPQPTPRLSCWNVAPGIEQKTKSGYHAVSEFSPTTLTAASLPGWQWCKSIANAQFAFDDEPSDPAQLETPIVFSGHISSRGETDRLAFSVQKGQRVRATVFARGFGFPFDSSLKLVDASGKVLASNDDVSTRDLARSIDQSRDKYDASLAFTAKEATGVELLVADKLDGHGPRVAYSVLVEEPAPSFGATVAADHFKVVAGKSAEVTVTIHRFDGFAKKLRIEARGLPDGVKVDAVVSETKGESAKSVKLKFEAKESIAVNQPFQLVAVPLEEDGSQRDAEQTATFTLRPLVMIDQLWLTVAPE